jgi:multimeric flavodoxin WrbA
MSDDAPLSALVLNCTLTPSPGESSSQKLAQQLLDELQGLGVSGSMERLVDYSIAPGVEKDMGAGDQWPHIRSLILTTDILIIATPTWMGHMSSIAQRALERLDAELSETDGEGRLLTYGKVAAAVVVGNEDGAHAIHADLFQGLNDVGFTIPAIAGVYWNGEAMHSTDYKDLEETPDKVASLLKTTANNLAHLARLLKAKNYPAL